MSQEKQEVKAGIYPKLGSTDGAPTAGGGTQLNVAFQRGIPDLGRAVSALCFYF